MRDIDERYITPEFLKKHFPAETLHLSREKYIQFRERVNARFRRSGHSPLDDGDLSIILAEQPSQQ